MWLKKIIFMLSLLVIAMTTVDALPTQETLLPNGAKAQDYFNADGTIAKRIVTYPDGRVETHTMTGEVEKVSIKFPDGRVLDVTVKQTK